MFTLNELQTIDILLQRINIQGNEAITIANLQVKVRDLINKNQTPANLGETTGTDIPKEQV